MIVNDSMLEWTAQTIRGIALDAVSRAGSGHAGTYSGPQKLDN